VPQSWRVAAGRLRSRLVGAPLPTLVVRMAAVVLAASALAAICFAAGPGGWLVALIRYPVPLAALALNVAGLVLCGVARREFLPEEPLHLVWSLAMWAAACLVTSGLALALAGSGWFVGAGMAWAWLREAWMRIGTVFGGPVHTALLMVGFWAALGVYRRAGMLARPRGSDWLLIALAAVFGAGNAGGWLWGKPGQPAGFAAIAGLVHGPLLGALLIEATLIRRSATQMGCGLIARCWDAFTLGIIVLFVMELGAWASMHSPIPAPMGATGWYLWLVASVAFAMAPAYQVEACRRAALPARAEREPALSGAFDGGSRPANQ